MQVILDAAQIAAVLLSLDLVYFLPDWTVTGMSAVLITQATTWQWMAVDCLLPGHSAASGAVLEAVLVLLLPGGRNIVGLRDLYDKLTQPLQCVLCLLYGKLGGCHQRLLNANVCNQVADALLP